jgi:DNA-binding transcriptional LysR family regulator
VNWDDLRFLLALRRSGSLSRAATGLRVDKATVSRRLATLARALGVPLLEHLPRGVRLTAAGEIAASVAERLDAEVQALLGEIGKGPAAAVRVTTPVWFAKTIAMPALASFRARHPDVELRLLTTSDVLDLPGRRADVALRNQRPSQAGLVVRRAGTLGSALYGASAYLRERGRPESRTDVTRHHLVAYESHVTYVPSFAWLDTADVPVSFRATDALSLLDATVSGLGLAVLPCSLGDADDSLERLDAFGIGHEEIWIVSHADLKRSRPVRAAMAWLAELFTLHSARLRGGVPETRDEPRGRQGKTRHAADDGDTRPRRKR